ETWWRGSDERLHVIGKGIVRFHAVYWPAILLSTGEPLPTTIFVHDYITSGDRKISKSLGAGDAFATIDRFGAEAVRWWLVREVPRAGDVEFREERVAARANELADGLGNLVSRTLALRKRTGRRSEAAAPLPELDSLPQAIDDALEAFDFRAATDELWERVAAANRFVSAKRPWELREDELAGVLDTLEASILALAQDLEPFLPGAAARLAH